jgi:DNA-binding protein H-NS
MSFHECFITLKIKIGTNIMAGNMDKQLSKMTLEELLALRAQVDKMIKDYQTSHRKDLRRRFKEMAAEMGMTVEEVLGLSSANPDATPVKKRNYPVKYINPSNPEQTWTGLGMRPRWIRAYIDNGGSIEDLRISA